MPDEAQFVRKMDEENSRRRSAGTSTLEKALIFLFVAMTLACIGLVVVYFTDKPTSSTYAGECVSVECYMFYSMSMLLKAELKTII